MCTDRMYKSVVLKADMFAYKRVNTTYDRRVFESPSAPTDRAREPGYRTRGRRLRYTIDEKTSSGPPGIYCYLSSRDIWISYSQKVIRVRIPKGSRAFFGEDSGRKVVLAEHVIPTHALR